MIPKNLLHRFMFLLALSAASSALAQMAQFPMADLGGNPTLGKLFGATKSFSARADTFLKTRSDSISMPMEIAMLDGQFRMDLDMGRIKSKELSAEDAAMMKQMGMSRMIIVSLPDQRVVRQVFPGLEAYAETALVSSGRADADPNVETKELGKESIDGHPCVKNRVTVIAADGKRQEATTWNATDLNHFPVKLEMPDKDGMLTMTFKDVKLTPPDAKLFAPPTGYTKHADMQQMMLSAMQKKLK